MFTGIVQSLGEVVKVEDDDSGRRIWVRADNLRDRAIGSSVALSGVCLTVVECDGEVCAFDVAAETVARSTLGAKTTGDHLNIETPMRAGDEFGGHIVQGHVDDLATIESVSDEGSSRRLRFRLRSGDTRYVVEKGSITLDGISLTITAVGDDWFDVALIPHTLEVTTLGEAGPGHDVNVEADVIAKYVERLTAR
jgi:riboflavin synthase